MKQHFQTLGIISKTHKPGMRETLESLINYLQSQHKTILISPDVARLLPDTSLPIQEDSVLAKTVDLMIVVGGDGSLLRAAHDLVNTDTPIIGINRGTLGFLTDIHPHTLAQQLESVFAGHYTEENRFLLDVNILQEEELHTHTSALNEMVLLPHINPHMIDFEIYLNDNFVCRERSDGLIIATPTGSTAYALSAGGPILHPELDAMVLVPLLSHTLSSRPLVISAAHELRIDISANNRDPVRIACDGGDCLEVKAGAQIFIQKKASHLRLIHPLDYDYFDALRSKLHWGKKHYHE